MTSSRRDCIVITGFVLQPKGKKLYCNRLVYIAIDRGWKQGAVYCNTLHYIAT